MMNEEQMLYCLIAFILGWLVSRHMGNGFNVEGSISYEFNPRNVAVAGSNVRFMHD